MTGFPKIITATRKINAWPDHRAWWAGEVTFGKNPVNNNDEPFEYTHYIRLDLHQRAVAALTSDIEDK